jgi:hypothetical protein
MCLKNRKGPPEEDISGHNQGRSSPARVLLCFEPIVLLLTIYMAILYGTVVIRWKSAAQYHKTQLESQL